MLVSPRSATSGTRGSATVYGGVHMLVDATTVTVVFAAIGLHEISPALAFGMVLLYDLLAFASQFLVGLVTDRLASPKTTLLIGLVLCALAMVLLPIEPWSAAAVAGLGNSLFHVGAGAITLYTRPGKATDAGIFVAPGALGLAFGMWIGKGGDVAIWPYIALLAVGAFVVTRLRDPELPYLSRDGDTAPGESTKLAVLPPVLGRKAAWIVGLLLLSIAVRSVVGMGGCHECPKEPLLALGIPLVAFGGKALGGIVSDRLGWIETSVGALLLSAPLIAFGGTTPWAILVGLLLFQMTMPVTLVAILQVMPSRPAFAFGLACLALIIGAVLTFFDPIKALYGPAVFIALIVLSATAIGVGLRAIPDRLPSRRLLPALYR